MQSDANTVMRNVLEALREVAPAFISGSDMAALVHVDNAIASLEAFLSGEGEGKRQGASASPVHAFIPHPKYPWFCASCGYAEHERLQHPSPQGTIERTEDR